MNSLRLTLVAALLPVLTACTATVPLDVTRQVALDAPAGGGFSSTQAFDLSTVPAVWSRRDHIDAVSIDEVTATVTSVGPGNQASSVSIAVALRADGAPEDGSQDLQVGTLADLPLAQDASVTVPGSAALEAFLLGVLHGSGRFSAIASGSLPGPTHAVVEVSLKGSAVYKVIGR